MKTLADKDMGIDCDFVAKGDTTEVVIKEMNDHVTKAHSEVIAEMSKTMSEEAIMGKMTSVVKDSV